MALPLSPTATSAPTLKCFSNCQLCIAGELVSQDLYFSPETGLITPNYYYRSEGVERIDLGGVIVAPGFLDLHTNGMQGIQFSQLGQGSRNGDESKLAGAAKFELEHGVTAFWATIPTVPSDRWKEILPSLAARAFSSGATLLGAHVEGPYLSSSHAGAHNASHFHLPTDTPPEQLYTAPHLASTIKLITLSPSLPGTTALIGHLLETYPSLRISLGHSSGSYSDGQTALSAGATSLTHAFNAMQPLCHRDDPGLVGLLTDPRCYYSLIADGIHVHPAVLRLAYAAGPARCILVSDSVALLGLPDGVHEYEQQGDTAAGAQRFLRKHGNRVTIDGTNTLVGGCCAVDEIVRNMMDVADLGVAEAVRCVTENVAAMMGERTRGVLEAGRRADFAILDAKGNVMQTWMDGAKVWAAAEKKEEIGGATI